MAARCELSSRSDGRDLAPWGGQLAFEPLLNAEAPAAAWRVVEAFSRTGLPFELALAWSSGGGSGATAQVTVSRATRICVFARGLRIQAGNLADAANRVGVTVADAATATENHWEATGSVTEQASAEVPVPPFARTVRVELADPALLPNAAVRLLDGQSVLRATVPANLQPAAGIPVGGARSIEIAATGSTAWRAVFTLSL